MQKYVKEIYASLEAERSQLIASIDRINTAINEVEITGDWIETAAGNQDKDNLITQLHNNHQRLKEVTDAIDRAKKPGFGICVICSSKIPKERILATMGKAARCIHCQERMERQQLARQYS